MRAPRGVVGDQPPQLYPSVTVHVPEPASDEAVARAALEALTGDVAGLKALEQRLAAQEHAVVTSFGQLGHRIQSLTDAVSAMAL